MRLGIVTYNIQYGVGQDGCYDLSRTLRALEGQDTVCLQEVTTHWQVCEQDNQPELLATGLNMFAAYAPAYEIDASHRHPDGRITNARRGFGNMVLSRWPIAYSRAHALPRPRTSVPAEFHPNVDFPRTALETVIDIDGTELRVVSVHLTHLPGAQRSAHVRALRDLTRSSQEEAPLWGDDPRTSVWNEGRPAPAVPKSTMILGDFNFEPNDADYAAMIAPIEGRGSGFVDGWCASTDQPSKNHTVVEPDGRISRIDYLFVPTDLAARVKGARVDHATTASDHFPVHFSLEL